MSIGLIFWVIMLLWILGFIGSVYSPGMYPWVHASSLMLFILLFLLGWHAFGFIVHASLDPAQQSAANHFAVPDIMVPERR